MLTVAELEVNVLDFRHRAFQFDRVVEGGDPPEVVFSRTETESERQLRPRLVRLSVVAPLPWILYDEGADVLRVAPGGALPLRTDLTSAVEVKAEPSEFDEQGLRWKRVAHGPSGYVYAPLELAPSLLSPEGLRRLGFA